MEPRPPRPGSGQPGPVQPGPAQPGPAQPGPGHPAGQWSARLESYGLRVSRGPAADGPLRRARDGQLFGGVTAGIARRTGFSVGLIRAGIVVATLVTTGYLAMAYVLAWLLIPAEDADSNIGTKALADRRGIGLAAALASVLVVALIIASALNAPWVTSLAVPIIACAVGLVLIVRNAPEDELGPFRGLADPAGMTRTAPGPAA